MARRPVFERSHHAERALNGPRPRWRGRTHRIAALLSVPAGAWLVATAPGGTPRWACAAFAFGTFAMFAASATYHWRRWSPHTTEVLLRLDHTGIYLAVGGTATAFAVLGLPPDTARVTTIVAWSVVAVGLVVEWLPRANPPGLTNGFYLAIGWGSVLVVPLLWRHAGPLAVVLLLAGGVLYTVGVVIVSRQRPDPVPGVFGYHEVWHALVIGAVTLHYVDVALLLR